MSGIARLKIQTPLETELGFDVFGRRDILPSAFDTFLDNQITQPGSVFSDNGIEGSKLESLSVNKLLAGNIRIDTYIQSTGYVAGTSGWRIDGAGNAEFASITLTGGTIKFGKTSFSDSTNAGYYISSDGIYIGAASDATLLKYTVASGLFDFVGTISSRATATIAAAINSGGNLITDIINVRLDSSTKKILSDFNFGTGDYAGGVKAGDITWNTTTGAITGGSGIVVYRGGIVGASSGVATFSIDAATGNATFAGTLSAPTGTLGSLQIASGGNIRQGQTGYNTGTGFWLGDDSGTTKFSIGDGTAANSLTWNGTVLTLNGSPISNKDVFGSGEDGAFTLDGTNTYATFMSKSGSDYTLIQDVFATNFTLSGTATLTTNGYRLFVNGTLTVGASCVIKWNGNNGADGEDAATNSAVNGGAGGAALSTTHLYGSGAGKAGGASGAGGSAGGSGSNGTAGTAGDAIANSFAASFSSTSGAGGNGGGSSPGTGAASGASGSITASSIRPYTAAFAVLMFDQVAGSSPAVLKYNSNVGGAGGGGGGDASAGSGVGGAGGGGGGSGSGGGIVMIAARIIVNAGVIQSIGGNGGNGGDGANGTATSGGENNGGGGGGGGGTGGPGGVLVLIYSTLSGAGTTSVAGGTAGTGGAKGLEGTGGSDAPEAVNGSNGSTGVSGKIIQLIV